MASKVEWLRERVETATETAERLSAKPSDYATWITLGDLKEILAEMELMKKCIKTFESEFDEDDNEANQVKAD